MGKNISISGIQTFAECPKKYKFQYVDRIYRISNEHFIFGSLGHKVMEYIGMGLPDEIILDYVENSKQLTSVQESLKALKINDLTELVKSYIKEFRKFLEKYEVISTEIKITYKDLVGVIDLVAVEKGTGKLIILDYKFSKYPKGEDDILNNPQLYMYAYLLNHMKGIRKLLRKYKIKSVYLAYFTLSKQLPHMPKVLQSGKLSKSMSDKSVTYEKYLEAIEKYELDRSDYEDILQKLLNRNVSLVAYAETKLTQNDLEEKTEEIESWVKLIKYATRYNYFPGRNAWNCQNCAIKKQCKNHLN